MDKLDLNKILDREHVASEIKNILQDLKTNIHNHSFKRGIYIYGEPGSGKTEFVNSILKELDCEVIKYDAGDVRNKNIIDNISKHNISDVSVMSLLNKQKKTIVIVMDEIDGMNNGDKGGINSLIKLIRPKKTKKQKLEDITYNPIICISNYHVDKKIKELIKVCYSFEISKPNDKQITDIIYSILPDIDVNLHNDIVSYLQGDLRKLTYIYNLYIKDKTIINDYLFNNILISKSDNENVKTITRKLISVKMDIKNHNEIMNETDRTIVGLLWHENIIDVLEKLPLSTSIPFYCKVLNNICFADYIDRITFQKQIWIFNEMSSLIKTFYNNFIYHNENLKKYKFNPLDVRFTKVLTKYSTEYNNSLFIQNLCQLLGIDKKDLFNFFIKLKNFHNSEDVYSILEQYDIDKLDINRMYRYIYKNIDVDNEP